MVRTKLTARRSYEKTRNGPAWLVNKEYRKKKTIYTFKIKQPLPEQKTVYITKNGQVVKTVNVWRKSKCFSSQNCLIF